jgi:hypothetical protein
MFSFLNPYLTAIKVGAIVALLVGDFYLGYHYRALGEDAAMLKAANEAAQSQKALDQDSITAAVSAAQHQATIAANTQAILKRISANVQKTDACPLSNNFVGLWAAGLSGTTQTTNPVQSDAAASPFTAVDALDNAVTNFGICNGIAQQLTDLQTLLKQSGD